MDEMLSKSKSGKKWKGSKSGNENLQVSKRVKGEFHLPLSIWVTWHIQWSSDGHAGITSQVLTSRFAQDDTGSVEEPLVTSADPIHFKRTICTISPNSGHYLFTELSTVETGLLDQNTMFLSIADHGKTKDVYGVSCPTTCVEVTCSQKASDDHRGWTVCCQETGRHREWSWMCTLARSSAALISRPCSVEEDGIFCQGFLHTGWTGGCWIDMYDLFHYLQCASTYDGL